LLKTYIFYNKFKTEKYISTKRRYTMW